MRCDGTDPRIEANWAASSCSFDSPINHDVMTAQDTCKPPSSNSCLHPSLATLFDDITFSDITFQAGDKQVHAHNAIVAAQSPVLRAMLQVSTVATTHQLTRLTYALLFVHLDASQAWAGPTKKTWHHLVIAACSFSPQQ